ncbi:hypothetical protein BH11MYX4_BH11MYX4_49610 [soil metagenome]
MPVMRPLTLLAVAATAVSLSHPAEAAPPSIAHHTCTNGLEVLVVESHANPTFTVEIAVKNGAMTEPLELNGLSHLYEHMFFKANAAIPNQEAYLARGRELGLSWNGTTNTERVNYFFSTTSDHFADAMTFMRDAITSPLFDAKELERERVVVTGEIDRNEASPQYYLWHEVEKRLWFKYPSRKDALGNRATVLKATQATMRLIQQRYYVPNNSVLVVTGDVSTKAVFDLADQLYSGWKKTVDPFIANPLVKHPPLPKSDIVVVEQPVQSYAGSIDWHGPSTVGSEIPATYAADLLCFATAESSSKFQKHLVESGACVSAQLNYVTQVNGGQISIAFEASPERIDPCVKAVVAELQLMRAPDYLSDEELVNAGRSAEYQFIRDREKPSALSSTMTFWWTSAGLDYYLGYVDNMKKVDRTAIGRYLDTYVIGKPFVFGSMVSLAMKKQGFDKAHFAKLAGAQL